jgi:hypothetical protein
MEDSNLDRGVHPWLRFELGKARVNGKSKVHRFGWLRLLLLPGYKRPGVGFFFIFAKF